MTFFSSTNSDGKFIILIIMFYPFFHERITSMQKTFFFPIIDTDFSKRWIHAILKVIDRNF